MSIGCPFFDQLPHRRFDTADGVAVELDLIDALRGPGGSLHCGAVATSSMWLERARLLVAAAQLTLSFLRGKAFEAKVS
jgi:hypothetical protein